MQKVQRLACPVWNLGRLPGADHECLLLVQLHSWGLCGPVWGTACLTCICCRRLTVTHGTLSQTLPANLNHSCLHSAERPGQAAWHLLA